MLKRPVTVKAYVYDQLKNKILSGEFRPGQRLTETTLADELEVSRTPVREALHRLELEGLITTSPYKGIYVTELTEKEMEDFYQTRAVLEGLAAKLAAIHATDDELKQFENFVLQMDSRFNRENEDYQSIEEIVHLNEQFHAYIFNMSKNVVITKMIASLQSAITLIRSTAWSDQSRKYQTLKEHHDIASAILQRDPTQAQKAMEEHIYQAGNSALRAKKVKN